MCKLVYIAAQRPLSLVNPSDKKTAIVVQELSENERGVIKRFSKPFVYYVGAYEGCGCGFDYGQYPIEDREAISGDRQLILRSTNMAI